MAANFASAASSRNISHGSGATLDNLGNAYTVLVQLKRTANGYALGVIYTKDTATNGHGAYVQNSGGEGQIVFYQRKSTTAASATSVISSMPLNSNLFIGFVFNTSDSQHCRIYIGTRSDLMVEASYASSTNGSGSVTNDGSSSFVVGNALASGGSTPFPGEISRVAVYARALTLAEMRWLQVQGTGDMSNFDVPANCQLASDYIDDGGGNVAAADVSGNSNTGTVTGATLATHAPLMTRYLVDSKLVYSPYNWFFSGTTYGLTNNTGAYVRLRINNSSGNVSAAIHASFDVSGLSGLGAGDCPVVGVSVNGGSPVRTQLATQTTGRQVVQLATLLANGQDHVIELSFQAIGFGAATDRWSTPANAVKFLGFHLDTANYTFTTEAPRPNNLLLFGASSLEGYASVAAGTAQTSHAAVFSAARHLGQVLNAEYGVVAFAGQGFVKGLGNVTASSSNPSFYNTTAANQSWDKYFSGQSRLTGGLFTPAPNWIIVQQGYNDAGSLTAATVRDAVLALRAAAPNAWIYLVDHQLTDVAELDTGYALLTDNSRISVIRPRNIIAGVATTEYTNDGLHSNYLGHAVLATDIAYRIVPAASGASLTGGGRVR